MFLPEHRRGAGVICAREGIDVVQECRVGTLPMPIVTFRFLSILFVANRYFLLPIVAYRYFSSPTAAFPCLSRVRQVYRSYLEANPGSSAVTSEGALGEFYASFYRPYKDTAVDNCEELQVCVFGSCPLQAVAACSLSP